MDKEGRSPKISVCGEQIAEEEERGAEGERRRRGGKAEVEQERVEELEE